METVISFFSLMNTSVSIPAFWWLRLRVTGNDGLAFSELGLQGKGPNVCFLSVVTTLAWKVEPEAYMSVRLASLQTKTSMRWQACSLAIRVLNGEPGTSSTCQCF